MVRVKRHISGLSDEEYISLLKSLTKQQYSDQIEDEDEDDPFAILNDSSQDWEPSNQYEFKEKKSVLPNRENTTDLTSAKWEDIKTRLHIAGHIRVGSFLVRIKRYEVNTPDITLDIEISEEKKKNFGGNTAKIAEKISTTKDSRFKNKTWITYFKNPLLGGMKIPIDTVADIIKYLQFVYANPAFL